jgi:hypothetical protein
MFINTRAISSLYFILFWLAKISDLAKSKFKMANFFLFLVGGFLVATFQQFL